MESELAAELGLSRNSLREAVRALSLIRILDVRQGDGTYVTSLDPPLLLGAVGFAVDFHRDGTVLEYLAVRRVLEPAATAMAAGRIAESELDALYVQLDALGEESPVEALVAADLELHRRIVRASGNRCCVRSLTACRDRRPAPGSGRALTLEHAVDRTLEEHRAILAALREGDGEAARSWATVHVSGVERWVRSTL